jgi:urease accessory protein
MLRATEVKRAGTWATPAADFVVLDCEARRRRRHAFVAKGGLAFLLDLPAAVYLRDGDGLALEDGRIVAVKAATEPLLEIRCADATELSRVAWHLGNRHLPTEIRRDRLRIRPDHVIADMARGLGASVVAVEAPFDPEGGAYDHGRAPDHRHRLGHDHHADHDRDHSH